MNNMIIESNKKQAYYDLPFYTKFIRFFTHKKRRIGYIIILLLIQYYDGFRRSKNWVISKRHKTRKKYENRWTLKYSPEQYKYQTAVKTVFKPSVITPENFEKLGKIFVEVDQVMLYGVSRQLIINSVKKSLDLVTESKNMGRFCLPRLF